MPYGKFNDLLKFLLIYNLNCKLKYLRVMQGYFNFINIKVAIFFAKNIFNINKDGCLLNKIILNFGIILPFKLICLELTKKI